MVKQACYKKFGKRRLLKNCLFYVSIKGFNEGERDGTSTRQIVIFSQLFRNIFFYVDLNPLKVFWIQEVKLLKENIVLLQMIIKENTHNS